MLLSLGVFLAGSNIVMKSFVFMIAFLPLNPLKGTLEFVFWIKYFNPNSETDY
jgi:hypothetical protein